MVLIGGSPPQRSSRAARNAPSKKSARRRSHGTLATSVAATKRRRSSRGRHGSYNTVCEKTQSSVCSSPTPNAAGRESSSLWRGQSWCPTKRRDLDLAGLPLPRRPPSTPLIQRHRGSGSAHGRTWMIRASAPRGAEQTHTRAFAVISPPRVIAPAPLQLHALMRARTVLERL